MKLIELCESYKLPHPNMVGSQLSNMGLNLGRKAFNQSLDNCLEIATKIASGFGYTVPNRERIMDIIWDRRADKLWGGGSDSRSLAYLLVKAPDTEGLSDLVHVAFEYMGKEYNYGPGNADGWMIIDKIPLNKLK